MLYKKERRRLNKGEGKLMIEAKKKKRLLGKGASGLEVWLAFGEMGRSALGMTKINIYIEEKEDWMESKQRSLEDS
jgi:hypothetical protein